MTDTSARYRVVVTIKGNGPTGIEAELNYGSAATPLDVVQAVATALQHDDSSERFGTTTLAITITRVIGEDSREDTGS